VEIPNKVPAPVSNANDSYADLRLTN